MTKIKLPVRKTTVELCSNVRCNSEYMDKRHGKGYRVFNLEDNGVYGTCTVCGTRKRIFDRPLT